MGWSAAYTITPESYTTDIRNTGVGWANALAKLGGLVAPVIAGLMLELENGHTFILLTMSALFFMVGLLSISLKETRGRNVEILVEEK